MTQPGQASRPHASFRFAVEIAGMTQAIFNECSGLSAQTEVFEFKEGGLNGYSHKLPGRTTYSNITLKRGMTDSNTLWTWYQDVIAKKDKSAALKDISIIQYRDDYTEVYRWNLTGAFPVRWTGPGFTAGTSAEAVESFELAFGDVQMVKQ